jgi:hypothetical protein
LVAIMPSPTQSRSAGASSVAVLVWPSGARRETAATLAQVRASVPAGVLVLVPSAAGGVSPANVTTIACPPDTGFARAVNEAARAGGAADLAIVAEPCTLSEGWLERLQAAATADDTVAAACSLAVGGGEPMFSGHDGDPVLRVPGAPGAAADALHPRILSLRPHCACIRRSTLELLGPLDESLTHPVAALAEYSARALSRGLCCALADDVCVSRLPGDVMACPPEQARAVIERHPWIEAAREEEESLELGPLRRSLVAARARGTRLSVTIDARALGPAASGTQTYVAGIVLALARTDRLDVRALVRGVAAPAVLSELEQAGVEILLEGELEGVQRTDIAHRPQQVFVPEDLALLRRLGERILVSHLDLIAYRIPTYHGSIDDWRAHRRVTRLALAAVDRVVFFSEHARRDALAEGLTTAERSTLAEIGVEPTTPAEPASRPERVPADGDFLLVLGADYAHKNRPFALELADELRRRHGWSGSLVLAGAHAAHGSSAAAERALLDARPELAARVLDLGPVSEPEKRWLLLHAQAHVCASDYEGFGLAPLEAASVSRPCIYAACASLGEIVDREAATIIPWDSAASADRAVGLLAPGEPRSRHLALLSAALARCTWESVVEQLLHAYRDAIDAPYAIAAPRAWEELRREELILALDAARTEFERRVEHGLPLIDEQSPLLTRQQQRGLMRVASRRWLRGPALGPFGLLGMDDRDPA